MKLTLKHQLAILGSSVSTVGAIAFFFGYWTNPTSKLSPLLLSYALGVGSVAAVAVARDRSGELKLAASTLKAELDRLQAKLDEEYQDKAHTTQVALQAQHKVEKLQERVGRLQADLDAAEGKNQEWMIAANQTAAAVQSLKEKLTEAQGELDRTVAHYQQADRKENHIAVKQQVDEIRSRLVVVQKRQFEEWKSTQQEKIYTELGKQQARVDELLLEVDRLTAEVEKLTIENEKLINENKQAGRDFYAIEHEALPKVQRMYEAEWSEHDRLVQGQIDSLREANARLSQPDRFPGETPVAKMANTIIDRYWSLSVTLDARWIDRSDPTSYKIYYRYRNLADAPEFLDILNDETNLTWIQLNLGLLSKPKFSFDAEKFHVLIGLHHSKVKVSDTDISKLCKSAKHFLEMAGKWQRIRITGGSETGKSPTAENVVYAMLKARSGQVKLYNPQNDSAKNHWSIESVGKSHKDSVKGLAELASLMDQNVVNNDLYIFDEVDSTFDADGSSAKSTKAIIKQASHKTIRCVFIGQNANASNYKGFQRSDFNNVVNLHIGSNANDAITNSNLPPRDKDKLLDKASRLTEAFQAKNDEFGLEKTDPNFYRFALVMEPEKPAYFIELPDLDEYQIVTALQENTESNLAVNRAATTAIDCNNAGNADSSVAASAAQTASNTDSSVAVSLPATPFLGIGCINCKTGCYTKTKSSRGVKYYTCNTCGKSKSENVLTQHFEESN